MSADLNSTDARAASTIAPDLVQRAIRNVSSFGLWNIGSMAAGFLGSMVLARNLGEVAFGQVSFAQTVGFYMSLLTDFGLNAYGSRAVARSSKQGLSLLANIASFQIVVAGILSLSAWIVARSLRGPAAEQASLVFLYALWLIPFAANIEWLYTGLQRMSLVGFGRFVQQAIALALILGWARGQTDVAVAPLSKVIGAASTAILFILLLPKGALTGFRLRLHALRESLKHSVYFFWLAALQQLFSGFAILWLNQVHSAREIGLYAAAFQIAALFTSALSLLNAALFPLFANAFVTDRVGFKRLQHLYLQLSTAVAVFILIAALSGAHKTVLLLFGPRYAESSSVLTVLAIGAAIHAINGAIAQPLLAAGLERAVLGQMIVTVVVNCAGNIAFCRRWGADGAAWAYVLGVFVGTVIVAWIYHRQLGFNFPFTRATKKEPGR